MAVIPNGQGSDKVIVWDKEEDNQSVVAPGSSPGPNPVQQFGGGWPQRFAVGDPETNTWQNYVLTIPLDPTTGEHLGDLFCAGHTWLPDGRLFVAGGNAAYGNVGLPTHPLPITPDLGGAQGGQHTVLPGHYYGSRIAAIWDPKLPRTAAFNYGWRLLRPMKVRRWYPTVTLLGNNTVMVSGGSETSPHRSTELAFHSYEVFNLANGFWNEGVQAGAFVTSFPEPSAGSDLGDYPRQHLLTNNRVLVVGMGNHAHRVWHVSTRRLA